MTRSLWMVRRLDDGRWYCNRNSGRARWEDSIGGGQMFSKRSAAKVVTTRWAFEWQHGTKVPVPCEIVELVARVTP
jgi:hypothetical protein